MGILLLNHAGLQTSTAVTLALIEEARELFSRVSSESENMELKRQAIYMKALTCLSSGDAATVLDLLGEKVTISLPVEPLIASAYSINGKAEEAKSVLQAGIFQNIVVLFNLFSSYLMLSSDSTAKFDETLRRALSVAEVFDLKRLHPGLFSGFLLSAAQGCMSIEKAEMAMEMLEMYTDMVTGNIYPLKLHGDSYFDLLDVWLRELDLGDSLPRSEKTIKKSMVEAVSENPAFSELSKFPRFTILLEKLGSICYYM
jgi:hypothetical protein